MKTTEETLGELFDVTVSELTRRVREGEASPNDIKNVLSLLKENNITIDDVGKDGDPMSILKGATEEVLNGLPRFPSN